MFIKEHQLKKSLMRHIGICQKQLPQTSQKQPSSALLQKSYCKNFRETPTKMFDAETYFLVKFNANCLEQL